MAFALVYIEFMHSKEDQDIVGEVKVSIIIFVLVERYEASSCVQV